MSGDFSEVVKGTGFQESLTDELASNIASEFSDNLSPGVPECDNFVQVRIHLGFFFML